MNRGNPDNRHTQLDLQVTRRDVGQPIRLIRVPFQIQPRDKSFIAANNDHRQQVRHHDHINQPQHRHHEHGTTDVAIHGNEKHVFQFNQKLIGIHGLRRNQTDIERRLQPTTGKNQFFDRVMYGARFIGAYDESFDRLAHGGQSTEIY